MVTSKSLDECRQIMQQGIPRPKESSLNVRSKEVVCIDECHSIFVERYHAKMFGNIEV